MPIWNIFHSGDAFTDLQKQEFANDITKFYVRLGLPAFYVVAAFHEIPESSFFVGGANADRVVRIVIEHIARHVEDPGHRKGMTEAVNAVMAPHTLDRGLYVEFHIDETPRDLWRIGIGFSGPSPAPVVCH
ncbi:tautomerase family protein [Nocardia testacea]|uniref:tautomerase family protein n=1 Tax=Nocardia testacea TaxID=248551 RepID=UPI003A862133